MTLRDLPDYTKQVVLKFDQGWIDLRELAARLRFPGPADLWGNVILIEDFESEETEWTLTPSGTGSAASRQTRHKYSGDWAVKLLAGDEENAYSKATRQLYHPPVCKMAVFGRLGWDVDLQRWLFGLTSEIAGEQRYAWLRYTLPTTSLELMTGAGTYTTLSSSLTISTTGCVFHPIMLTFDLSTMMYDKLYLDDKEYDVSDYGLGSAIASPGPYLEVKAEAHAVGSTGCTIYVDDIIIAKGVP